MRHKNFFELAILKGALASIEETINKRVTSSATSNIDLKEEKSLNYPMNWMSVYQTTYSSGLS